ncbi:MAG: biopolymer transporter ExbD [Burkholderiaceae bacterium]
MSFGRLEKPAGHRPMSDINVTPLVDVMLVLLVIFIIAAPVMASRLQLDLPRTDAPLAVAIPEPTAVVVALDAEGVILLDEQPVDIDALRQRLAAAAGTGPEAELQLRADARVPYGRVVQIIGLAQAAGLSRIGFVAEPDETPAAAAGTLR